MKKSIGEIRTFDIYYGTKEGCIRSERDLIVVEPKAVSDECLRSLRDRGCCVLAYLSVAEVAPDSEEAKHLAEEDFLHHSGQRILNEAYGNYLADPTSEKWGRCLRDKIWSLLDKRGFDGLFIDTLSSLEKACVVQAYGLRLHHGVQRLLREIRSEFPEKLILQNNGLNMVIDFTKDEVDGVCWENPPAARWKDFLWGRKIERKLKAIEKGRRGHPCRRFAVFVVNEEHHPNGNSERLAKRNDWPYCLSTKDYA